MQGVESARHDAEDERAELIAAVREAAMPAANAIASARQVALALSDVREIREPTADCNDELARTLRSLSSFSSISRLDAHGRVACSTLPGAVGSSIVDLALWRSVEQSREFVLSGMKESRHLHRPVVRGALPLHDSRGRFDGTINVAIDAHWLYEMVEASHLPANSVVAIFDRDGKMIAANNTALGGQLFAHATMLAGRVTTVRSTGDDVQQDWTAVVAPLPGRNLFVGFAQPTDARAWRDTVRLAIEFILPFLMIVLTWLTIWVVTERQLTRWVLYLCRIAATYRSGHYSVRPALANAPSELQLLGDSLAEMATSIQDRDRSLREAVAQKTLLIKEIHHRVKNNLQIVMSLLSLQAGRLKDPAAQQTLKQTRARINALALVHRILYELDDQRVVDVKPLLEQIAEQTSEGFGADRRDVRIVVDAMAREVPSEVAVPLALLTVEALTNAFKHAFPPGRGGTIRVIFEPKDDHLLRLAIEDDGVGFIFEDAKESIGARLIKTLGQQAGGAAKICSNAGNGATVEITFPDPGATG